MAIVPTGNTVVANDSASVQYNYTPALIAMAVLYFMMGFITVLNDTLVPFFKMGFTLTYAQSSLVQFYFFLTYGVMSIPAGRIVEKIGFKHGMVLGFFIAAIGALLFFPAAILNQYYLFLGALFIIAIGIVLLQVAANPYITVLGPARTASSRLTLIQGIGSIGTTTAPIFGAYFILAGFKESHASSDAVKYPYLFIAFFLLFIAFVVFRLKLPAIKPASVPGTAGSQETKSIFSFRNLKFGAWAIFFYVGAEVAIGTFLTNYISAKINIAESEANTYVSVYWGSMLVGRFIGSLVLNYIQPSKVLTFCAVAALLFIGISINTTGYLSVYTMLGVGLCNSIMFAIIFSLSVQGLGSYTTKASGILSTAIVGGAIISYIQGVLIDEYSWEIAFALPLICYAYILFYGINGYKGKLKEEQG
ncbi:MAG: sugar MFS transporter [Daejeonella sp.]|uniref:sugar MFS transporter n=1 Tax=Daejeonella sp. JGW-45 TaxID=3034148 RepID=UPI0023EB1194|nr:sugar MFS transporter [Daejeonella sp. JGW-45]